MHPTPKSQRPLGVRSIRRTISETAFKRKLIIIVKKWAFEEKIVRQCEEAKGLMEEMGGQQ